VTGSIQRSETNPTGSVRVRSKDLIQQDLRWRRRSKNEKQTAVAAGAILIACSIGSNRHRTQYDGDSRNVWVRVAVPGRGQALHVGEGNMLLELFPRIASTMAMFGFLVLTAK
jgi:hypothetical protein